MQNIPHPDQSVRTWRRARARNLRPLGQVRLQGSVTTCGLRRHFSSNARQTLVKHDLRGAAPLLVKHSSNSRQTVVKHSSNSGQTVVKQWSNSGQTVVKEFPSKRLQTQASRLSQHVVKDFACL
eukprot:1181411-Prorocentrum_minimum.AAC.2